MIQKLVFANHSVLIFIDFVENVLSHSIRFLLRVETLPRFRTRLDIRFHRYLSVGRTFPGRISRLLDDAPLSRPLPIGLYFLGD